MALKGWKKYGLENGEAFGLSADKPLIAIAEALSERLVFFNPGGAIKWTFGEVKPYSNTGLMNFIDGQLDTLIPCFLVPFEQGKSYFIYDIGRTFLYPYSIDKENEFYLWKILGETRIDSRHMTGGQYHLWLPWLQQVIKVINLLQTVNATPLTVTGDIYSLYADYQHEGHGIIGFHGWTDRDQPPTGLDYRFGLRSAQWYGGDTSPAWYYDGAWHGHNVPEGLQQWAENVTIGGKTVLTYKNYSLGTTDLVKDKNYNYTVAVQAINPVKDQTGYVYNDFSSQKTDWIENKVVVISSGETVFNGTALNVGIGTIGNPDYRPPAATEPTLEQRFSWRGSDAQIFFYISPVFEFKSSSIL